MSNQEIEIDWKLIFSDLSFSAIKMALADPECREELRPIVEKRNKILDEYRKQEDEILDRYKEKYYKKLCKKQLDQKKLALEMLRKEIEEGHGND